MSATARLMAFLGMDASQFTGGVDKAEKRTQKFGQMLSGMKGKIAAAFTVGAAVKIGKDALAMGDMLGETASNLGINTDELQALSFMFKTTGSSAETFEKIMNKVNGTIGDVNNGSEEARKKLEKMGVTEAMMDEGPVAVLEQMGKYLNEAGGSAGATADVFDVLGEKSRNATNALKELGSVGAAGVIKGAYEAGRVLSESEIAALGKAQDKLDAAIDWARKKAAQAVGGIAKATTGDGAVPGQGVSTGAETRRRADEAAAAKLVADASEIRKKNEYDALDAAGKILAIKEEIAALDKKMADATTQTAKAEADKQRAELEGKLQGLEGQQAQGPGMAYDQLRRIGAGVFRGTADNAVEKRQLAVQTKMEKHLETLTKGDRRELGRF